MIFDHDLFQSGMIVAIWFFLVYMEHGRRKP